MIKLLLSFIVYGIIFWFINKFSFIFWFSINDSYLAYIFVWWIAYMINKIIRPIITFLAIPINIVTLWLTWTLINVWMVYILQYIVNYLIWEQTIQITSMFWIFLLSIILSFVYKVLDIID